MPSNLDLIPGYSGSGSGVRAVCAALLRSNLLSWYLWISLGVVILLIEKMIYSEALLFLDVGAAYTIGSLNLIAVTFMSRCLLREKVTRKRWIGVCLIFIGVSLVAART